MKPVLWENKSGRSIEYFSLTANGNALVLEGTIIMQLERLPAQISYRIECDRQWRTRIADIRQERSGKVGRLSIKVGKKQDWQANKRAVPFAAGMHDIDLEVTPSTNTLSIRRLALKEGESQQVDAVWVRFPSLTLERLQQRYTRIGRRLYKYETSTGYKAELEVDQSGLVVRYGDLWRRV
jgi:hypothetical protein